MRPPLVRLAELHGIEPAFEDAYGERREVAPSTLEALLAAMGVAASSDGAIAESLLAAGQERWAAPLAPVEVRRAGQSLNVPVGLAAGSETGRLRWRLCQEDGRVRTGERRLDEMPVIARGHVGGEAFLRRRLALRLRPPIGTHRLEVELPDGRRAEGTLIVAPERGFGLEDLGRERLWGLSTQVYALHSARDWGIGDFTDLAALAAIGAGQGAGALGINPVHALFPAEPRHISPYSPSNRLFLNPLYIDVEAVPEFAACEEARALLADPLHRARIEAARAAELIDHAAVAQAKLPVLDALFAHFREQHLRPDAETARGRAFLAFVDEMGASLERHAIFDALHEHFYEREGIWSWRNWPEALRDPASPEVRRFAEDHAGRVGYFQYLQWVADEQLGAVQQRATDAGMPLGIYRDLAVGVHPDGAMVWGNPEATVVGAAVGAPPDPFNARGQNWGLAPLSPRGLRSQAYALLARDLRQNMRHAGALRIDHVMGLSRLFWIPDGGSPADGAYVRYPLDDLLGVVALESARARCLVIGEDLGTVEPGFRERMQASGILSYRVLYFERTAKGGFAPPESYPAQALVTASTHDLPTLAGFWSGRDLEWRQELDLFPDAASGERVAAERARERLALLAALREAGFLEAAKVEDGAPPRDLMRAVCQYLAEAPSALLMLQLEDVQGEVEQANLPGTTDEHPNWRRRLARPIEEIARDPALADLAGLLRRAGRGA